MKPPTLPRSPSPADAFAALRDLLSALRIGEPQTHKGITIFPLTLPGDSGPDYLSLDDAMASGRFQVAEVSQAGSVPELKVINQCDRPVLLIDGEELLGAKQNRVVNASLLLRHGEETVIPVSCTEQGRWRTVSRHFVSSDAVMEFKVRRHKSHSVSTSLYKSASYGSDQAGVWDQIDILSKKSGFHSPTGAMHEIYLSRQKALGAALEAFPGQPGQHGVLVFINGRPAGLEYVSRSGVYTKLHGKLVRSYILDALLEEAPPAPGTPLDATRSFLAQAAACQGDRFRSVGCGESLRGQSPLASGMALVHEGVVIHAAFFAQDKQESVASPPLGQGLRGWLERLLGGGQAGYSAK